MKLFILILLVNPSWSFWCYSCNRCNPDINENYRYCDGPYCELKYISGRRNRSRQSCSDDAPYKELGCTFFYKHGKKVITCYCNEAGCNNGKVFKIQYPVLIVSSILMFLVWIKNSFLVESPRFVPLGLHLHKLTQNIFWVPLWNSRSRLF